MGLITIGEPSGDDSSSWQSVPESSNGVTSSSRSMSFNHIGAVDSCSRSVGTTTGSAGGSARRTVCISMPETFTDTSSTAGRQSNTTAPAIVRGSCSVSRNVTCVAVFGIHLCDRRRRPGGLGLAHNQSDMPSGFSDGGLIFAHESSILPDTCVTCGPALPSGVSDGGLSPAHESSILPDTCVTCGPALPSDVSDGGLSLAHESSIPPDTCVTCGPALPSDVSDGGQSLAHESSILPDTCVSCGLALLCGFSDGGLSLAHKSSIMPDTCVTCGPTLLTGFSGTGVVLPVR